MFQNHHLILQDVENNTLVSIISHCYKECIRARQGVPELSEISDRCLEYVVDYGIKMVTYCGIKMSAISALEMMLVVVLEEQGFVYRQNNMRVDPNQLIMFDEL